MIAILGIIPAVLIGIIFFTINPVWSVIWALLVAGEMLFLFKRKRQRTVSR